MVLLLWALLYLPAITTIEIDKSDARRIYPSLKMLESGDWAVPEYGGESYFRKPPMFNWMIAASVEIFGKADDFSVRMPTRICVLFLSLLIAGLPSGWLGRRERLLAALVFMSSAGIFEIGRAVEIDACYVAFTGAATLLWLNAYSLGRRGFVLWLPPAFALGVALLLKGPIALLFHYVAIVFVLRRNRESKMLASPSHIVSFSAMLAIFLIWYFQAKSAMPAGSPEKMSGTWMEEMLFRLNPANIEFDRWFKGVFGAVFAFMPWLLFLPRLWTSRTAEPQEAGSPRSPSENRGALRKSLIAIFATVNLMPGVKPRYSMPAYPLASMLLASCFGARPDDRFAGLLRKGIRLVSLIFALLSILAACGFAIFAYSDLGGTLKFLQPAIAAAKGLGGRGWLLILAASAFACAGVFMGLDRDDPGSGGIDFRFAAVLWFTLSAALLASAFLMPLRQQKEKGRNFAAELDRIIPEKCTLLVHQDISTEAFLFYMRKPFDVLEKSFSSSPGNSFLLLVPAEILDVAPENSVHLRYGKKNYLLLKP